MLLDPVLAHGVIASLAQLGPDLLSWIPLDGTPADPVPEDHEVKAGWTALFIWIALAVLLVFGALSFVKRMRNARDHFADVDADAVADEPDPRFDDRRES